MNIAHAIETFGIELSLEVRLRTVEHRRSQIGHSYALVQFEDATGNSLLLERIIEDEVIEVHPLPRQSCQSVSGRSNYTRGGAVVSLHAGE